MPSKRKFNRKEYTKEHWKYDTRTNRPQKKSTREIGLLKTGVFQKPIFGRPIPVKAAKANSKSKKMVSISTNLGQFELQGLKSYN